MKRAVWSIIFGGATVLAFAGQGSFTIVRPFDGSKVRETIKVLMPKSSVPEGTGYVGVFLNGEFREAFVPKASKDGKYLEYPFNTKDLEDGSYKLELKLYVDYSSQPRIVDTSSVDIVVANKSSINVPEEGINLRYAFRPGTESIYRLQQREVINVISEADQKKSGDRPFQISEEGEAIRLLYACDNAYPNGEGLIRMQVLPDKGVNGREYAKLTASGESSQKKYYPEDMAPIYMRITSTGREVFGSIPDYFGFDGNLGSGNRFALFAAFPLPVLPTKNVRVGDTWQPSFQTGAIDLDKKSEVNTVVNSAAARGEFKGVEWEQGHPCAVIKNSIAQGSPLKTRVGSKMQDIADRKISVEETIWFALDTKKIVQYYRDITVEGKSDMGFATGSTGGDTGGGQASRAGAGAAGGGGGKSPEDFIQRGGSPKDIKQRGGPGGRPPMGGPQGGPPGGGRPQMGGAGMGPMGGQGAAPAQQSFVRVRKQYIFTLEK
jgi:hypothetical protein